MKDRIHYVTPEGLKKLQADLEQLTVVKRREIAERLTFAIQQGDITENADYDVAKQEQALNEVRIKDLETILRYAQVIKSTTSNDEVQVGSRVTVVEEGLSPETYTIVGPAEALPEDGRISNESPVGAALLGRRVGDQVRVRTPAGELSLTVTAIH